MPFREMEELAAMVAHFNVEAIKEVDPAQFIGFGMKDFHVYRQMFLEATKSIGADATTWIIILATAVKNRERIITELNTKFQTAPWRAAVYSLQRLSYSDQGYIER